MFGEQPRLNLHNNTVILTCVLEPASPTYLENSRMYNLGRKMIANGVGSPRSSDFHFSLFVFRMMVTERFFSNVGVDPSISALQAFRIKYSTPRFVRVLGKPVHYLSRNTLNKSDNIKIIKPEQR